MVFWFIQSEKGTKLASTEAVGSGERQRVIDQLEGPLGCDVDQFVCPWKATKVNAQKMKPRKMSTSDNILYLLNSLTMLVRYSVWSSNCWLSVTNPLQQNKDNSFHFLCFKVVQCSSVWWAFLDTFFKVNCYYLTKDKTTDTLKRNSIRAVSNVPAISKQVFSPPIWTTFNNAVQFGWKCFSCNYSP